MKKIWGWIVGVVVVIAAGAYILFGQQPGSAITPPVATNTGDGTTPPTPTATSGSSTDTGGTSGTGQYKNGTYTGSVENAIYGNLQVAVTISGGAITNVAYPVSPNAPGHTSEVSAFALPALAQEAIAVQSANVAIVSGATQDSQAFQQSLAAALAQAKR